MSWKSDLNETNMNDLNKGYFVEMPEFNGSDSAALSERVAILEAGSTRQYEELVKLRTSLAEALRRLSILEKSSKIPNGRETNTGIPRRSRIITHQPNRNSSCSLAHHQNNSNCHHVSAGSLQSDSATSSTSQSPVPSPTPRTTFALPASPPAASQANQYRSRNNTAPSHQTAAAAGGNNLTKRWNSTGDFKTKGYLGNNKFTNAKSLLNLHLKTPGLMVWKHGSQNYQYNDEEGSVRMYLRGRPVVVYAPTEDETLDPYKVAPPPQNKLKLEWVYGYRGKDCRSNIYLLPTGEIVYFVAAVVVLFNVEEQCQRHYTAHTDDVKCIAVHPNKLVVATGQCAGHNRVDARPHVRVWNSVTLTTLAVVGSNHFVHSVSCLSFSKADGGTMLACVDEGPEHSISLWDWQRGDNGHCIAETKYMVDTVIAVECHPLEKSDIVTCGKNHIAFWSLNNGNVLYKRMGVFEGLEKPKYITCLAFNNNGDVLSGDSNGNILVWQRGTNVVHDIRRHVHQGPIFSICTLKEGNVVTAGGRDGKLLMFDQDLNPTDVESCIDSHFGGVRVVAEGKGDQLYIGTTKNCILYGDLRNGFTPAVLGHVDEVWGLATHPTLPQFVTAGWDKLLQLWDGLSHSTVWSKDIDEQAQSCAWSQDGSILAVGCLNGNWLVVEPDSRDIIARYNASSEPIQTIVFSPDNKLVALGSRDNFIYVYQVEDNGQRFTRIGKCVGHSSYITHLDWTEDSRHIRSSSGDYELLFWNATTCRQVNSPSKFRDTTWATNYCPITYQTLGIWPENADGTDINSCARSPNGKLMATSDDFGKVKLFAYPVTQPKSLSHAYSGHSSHVTCVRFLPDNSRLISTGGLDTSVMQWVVD